MNKGQILKVHMLGEFSAACDDVKLAYSARAYRNWMYIAYMILNRGRVVSKQELLRLLSDPNGHTDPNRTLRNRRMRTRQLFEPLVEAAEQEFIIVDGDEFRWNAELPMELDAGEFEALCRTGSAADGEERLNCFRRALALFGGDLLDMFSAEPWVVGPAAHCRDLYLDAVEQTMCLLEAAGDEEELESLCRRALRVAPYHESLYCGLMRSLMRRGRYEDATETYQELRELLASEMDVTPTDETQELYRELLRYSGESHVAPESIRASLRNQEWTKGPMFCDYDAFKMFYQAEARAVSRRGSAVHIGVLSVVGRNGTPLTDAKMSRAMEQLRTLLHALLRSSDIVTTCSASQYLVMLVQANQENAHQVCRRIADAFHCAHPRSPARIDHFVLPLEPAF